MAQTKTAKLLSGCYLKPEICALCGGACCRHMPGAAFPTDFGSPFNPRKLDEAIGSGYWAIDWWEGDPRIKKDELGRAYFVRARVKGKPIIDPSWGGECVFSGRGWLCTDPGRTAHRLQTSGTSARRT